MASANIVGYNTVTINQEWTILAVNFSQVDGSNLSIQDAFPPQAGMTKGMSTSDADQIQVLKNDGGYKIYYLSNGIYKQMGKEKYDEAIDVSGAMQKSLLVRLRPRLSRRDRHFGISPFLIPRHTH